MGGVSGIVRLLLTGVLGLLAFPLPAQTISLSRSGCLGTCPEYSVSIAPDGAIVYRGTHHVRLRGEHRAQADAATYAKVRTELDRVHYGDLPYETQCARRARDTPSLAVTVTGGERPHSVQWNTSCEGPPPYNGRPVVALGEAIDRLLDSRRWTGDVPVEDPEDQE